MNQARVISLIGRPNVGKSSIFNRLMNNAKLAITHNQPGVTRDRHFGVLPLSSLMETLVEMEVEEVQEEEVESVQNEGNHRQSEVYLVDTGGFYPDLHREVTVLENWKNVNNQLTREMAFEKDLYTRMAKMADMSIEESDLVLIVVDVREGILPFDQLIVESVRRKKKRFLILVNKADSAQQDGEEVQFYNLGIREDQLLTISASHGRGFWELKQKLAEIIQGWTAEESKSEASSNAASLEQRLGLTPREEVVANLAIIGAPNAGKSTLLNKLLGSERALVSPVPGTTVDPIQGHFDLYFGEDVKELLSDGEAIESESENESESGNESGMRWRSLKIVDTAGIRRKKSVQEFVESQSVFRALRAIDESDIVVYLVDSSVGLSHQDSRLCDIILEKGKSLILCMNKIDLVEKEWKNPQLKKEWWDKLHHQIPWLEFCQVIPLAGKTGKHFKILKEAIRETVLARHKKISTGRLNRFVSSLIDRNPIVLKHSYGKRLKIKYVSLVKSGPPTFLMFSNLTENIPPHYRRYLINGIRREFKLVNTPIHLIFRKKSGEREVLLTPEAEN